MARAARRKGSEAAMDAARGVWAHSAAARFRGGVTAALGLGLALALATYNPGDPSFDAAASGAPANLLGGPGATLADLGLQGLGLGAWIAAAVLLALGVSRAADPAPASSRARLRWRAASGMLGLALLAGAFSAAAPPAVWPLASGLGGLLGDAELNGLTSVIAITRLPGAGVMAGLILAMAGIVLTAIAVGVRWTHVAGVFVRAAPARRPIQVAARAAPGRSQRVPAPAPEEIDEIPPTAAAPLAIKTPKSVARPSAREARERQPTLPFAPEGSFKLPELAMLAKPKPRASSFDEGSLRQNARLLEGVLAEFGVRGQIDQIRPGPVVTLYELVPAPGVKSARVVALSDDIARSMSVAACRVSVVSGRNAIGIELPNARRETVYLRDLLASGEYEKNGPILPLALGETIGGEPYIADLSRMPHLLIAGTTGSGKSVGVNAMILSILYRLT